MLERSSPWHARYATTQHFQWFRNLAELHELTSSWLRELKIDQAPYRMTRGLNKDVTENLWMLDSLSGAEIEPLLDDTYPDDTLGRLEHTVWAVQAWTLGQLFERTQKSGREALESVLEQTSWKQGRVCAEQRWSQFPSQAKTDLRGLYLAVQDSPLAGYPHLQGFLVKRAIETEIQLELRTCPHQSHFSDVRTVADPLCLLHMHWMRGFLYSLNNKVTIDQIIQPPRCTQRWFSVS